MQVPADSHKSIASPCHFVRAAPLALAYNSIATVNRWNLTYSLLKKAITGQSVLAFPLPWQFFFRLHTRPLNL